MSTLARIFQKAQEVGATVSEAVSYAKGKVADIDPSQIVSLDDIGRKIASLGTPAIAFAVAASIAGGTGLAGGAVITTALAMLGGPLGMVGGLLSLGVLTIIADAVSKYGIEAVLGTTFQKRIEQGITIEQVYKEIGELWLSDEIKFKIKSRFNQND
jgi:hypothetical protein